MAKRITSIDTLKVVAIFGVVYIHVGPFRGLARSVTDPAFAAGIINQCFRFGVPFFFLAAGFFFGRSVLKGTAPGDLLKRYCVRLLRIFFVWSALYVLAQGALKGLVNRSPDAFLAYVTEKAIWIVSHPMTFLLQGTKEHLWFLPALAIGLCVVTCLVRFRVRSSVAFSLVAVLYLFGLIGDSYSVTAAGVDMPFNPRNGPFVSSLFVYVGYWLSDKEAPSLRVALLLTLAGLALELTEAIGLWRMYNVAIASHDNLLGTALYGIGAFILALNFPSIGASTFWPKAGALTLGIYTSHMLVALPVLKLKETFTGAPLAIATPFVVFLGALLLSWLLTKSKYSRWLVV